VLKRSAASEILKFQRHWVDSLDEGENLKCMKRVTKPFL